MKNKVWITSTARKISLEELQPAIDLLRAHGLTPVLSATIGADDDQFAGNDELRQAEFQKALDDPEISVIWCARGGYGTVRIIDKLDFTRFLKKPKPIIGYSDVTVIHSHLQKLGSWSVHATMPVNIKNNSKMAISTLLDAIFERELHYSIPSSPGNRMGTFTGKLVGGNLSILYSLLGSPTSIDTKGRILFLEDLDEYLYHIDRMIVNLKRNGYFDGLGGLVIGSFTKMHDNTVPFGKTYKEIILEAVAEYDFPVMFDFPAGHTDDNRAMIIGNQASLTVGPKVSTLHFR